MIHESFSRRNERNSKSRIKFGWIFETMAPGNIRKFEKGTGQLE